MSHAALERAPRIPKRPPTAATSLKTPNPTTRPTRALRRRSQLPRAGVYNYVTTVLHTYIDHGLRTLCLPNLCDRWEILSRGSVLNDCVLYIRWNQVGLCWRVITQGVVLISVAGPRPSPSVMTSPAPPPTRAALPVLWRRMRPQRTMTQAWWVHYITGLRRTCVHVFSMCTSLSLSHTLQESLSSAGTPHKRDSLTFITLLEDSISSSSRGSSLGERGGGMLGEAAPACW